MGATGVKIKLQSTQRVMSEEEINIANATVKYSFESVVAITGVDRATIIEYCQTGLLPVAVEQVEGMEFDDQMINLIRRVERLRTIHGINQTGIRMIMDLTDELERLRQELKFRLDA